MKQGGYLDGVKKQLLLTEGILATITTMGNMFLQTRQVIDFRVQTCPNRVRKLWNIMAIVCINVMNKSSSDPAQGNKQLPPCYLHNWSVFTNSFSDVEDPGPTSGAT